MTPTPLPRIMVAPNGARRSQADHPALPVTISQIVDTAKACHDAGAGGLHAHVRNAEGLHVLDAGQYRELIAEMRVAVPDMMVQITTEAVGRYSPAEQRQVVRDVMPEAVSVGLGEMLQDHQTGEAGKFYHWAADAGIAVQHILYSPDDIRVLSRMIAQKVIRPADLKLLFVAGRYATNQQSDPGELSGFLTALSASGHTADWALCAFGRSETLCLTEALKRGGKARVGFENSLWNKDGKLARDNAERVTQIAGISDIN